MKWRNFKQKNFRNPFFLFLLGQVLSQTGESVSIISLSWFVMNFGHNTLRLLSVLYLLQALPAFLFGGMFGHIIDSPHPKRHILIAADTCRGLIFSTIPLLAAVHILTLPLFFFLVFCAAFFSGIFGPAMFASVPEFDFATPMKRNVYINMTAHIGLVTGPIVGGILVAILPAGNVIAVTGITFVVSAIFIFAGLKGRKGFAFFTTLWQMIRPVFSWTVLRLFFRGFFHVGNCPDVKILYAMSFLSGVALGPIVTGLPFYIRHVLHGTSANFGFVVTLSGLGMLAMNYLLSRIKTDESSKMFGPWNFHRQEKILIFFLFLSGELLIPLGAVQSVFVVAVLSFFSAGLGDVFNPLARTEILTFVDEQHLGRVFTTFGTWFLMGYTLSTIATPFLERHIGFLGLFVVAGSARILSALMALMVKIAGAYNPKKING